MLSVDADIPGGNILVDQIDGDELHLRPDLRDTDGEQFYWCFRVRHAAGRRLRVRFAAGSPVAALGPAVSVDGGMTWRWLGQGSATKSDFEFLVPPLPGDSEVRFGMGMTYTRLHFERFLQCVGPHPMLQSQELCRSRAGRSVLIYRIGTEAAPHRVLVTARHHACEMMASFAVEGLLQQLLSDDRHGRWLLANTQWLIAPFMDLDGVEAGDQGKNRRPHDHNRDYGPGSIYPEVAALKEAVPAWLQDNKLIMLDLHCPWIRGGNHERLHLVGDADLRVARDQATFSAILQQTHAGPLPYLASDNIPYGTDWNTAANYGDKVSATRWAVRTLNTRMASSIEIPYAVARDIEVNADSARAFGKDMARAIAGYLT